MEQREAKPTTVMPRDELLGLVKATAAAATSLHVLPRLVLAQRDMRGSPDFADVEIDLGAGVSRLFVLAVVGLLIGLFAAIVVRGA